MKDQLEKRIGNNITIDVHQFDPTIKSAADIRKEIDSLLNKEKPSIVKVQFPDVSAYALYGDTYRTVILPHLLLKTKDYNYWLQMDTKSLESLRNQQLSKYIKGDEKRGYKISSEY